MQFDLMCCVLHEDTTQVQEKGSEFKKEIKVGKLRAVDKVSSNMKLISCQLLYFLSKIGQNLKII